MKKLTKKEKNSLNHILCCLENLRSHSFNFDDVTDNIIDYLQSKNYEVQQNGDVFYITNNNFIEN